ncbi:ribonuclease P protein component [Frigidibacter albus]|uniref:Ribonuclease P protein component n=1 Tax=Frigidibacter mobilis TaxID=1335048 RepID=A0A159YZ29_9RHOB|nr:ribonuclease P [Frigidibacter mobilis]
MPPVAPVPDPQDRKPGPQPAVSVCPEDATVQIEAPVQSPVQIEVLARRPDFLRAAQARRQGAPGFLLQARQRRADEPAPPDLIRIGYTCSKKIGNAVARNRAKRRLREIARAVLPLAGRAGWDYVLVGRPGATADRLFADLLADLARALTQIHAAPAPRGNSRAPDPGGPVREPPKDHRR